MTLYEARALVAAEEQRERLLRRARERVKKAEGEEACARGEHQFLGQRGWLSNCARCGEPKP